MKLKQEMVLRQVAGDSILIPITGLTDEFRGIITLNSTGVRIWKLIEAGKEKNEIVDALLEEYEVEREQAQSSVDRFCGQREDLGIL